MDSVPVSPSRQIRITVWLTLLIMAALAWAIVVQQAQMSGSQSMPVRSGVNQNMSPMGDMSQEQPAMPMSSAPVSIVFYLPLWVSMMVAMMFPAVAPMVSFFATISRSRRAMGQRAAPTWLFLAGYLVVWTLFGVAAYLVSLALPSLGMMAAGLRIDYPVAAGIILIATGLYQLSPLKQGCLRHCRSPLSVVLHGWHDGSAGAFRMGFEHGAYCVGCCWGLMLVLFVVGMMNLIGMVILTAIIFVEKVVPRGPLVGKLAALALIVFGIVTLVGPFLNRT